MTVARSTETLRTDLQIDALRESLTNPRQQFDPAALAELAASIAKSGVLVPLIVRNLHEPAGNGLSVHEIIAGARRFRAAKIAELTEVPCIVRELTDAEAADIQIIENLQRADVHPVEEAEGYRALQSAARALDQVLTAEDIAKRVGKPVRHVATLLKLLDLGIDSKQLFAKGHITLDHALLLAPLTEADQILALHFMLDSDVTQHKHTLTEIIRNRIENRLGRLLDEGEGLDADPDAEAEPDSPSSSARVAKYMLEGRRLIDATPAQLKLWIEGNVLLRLVNAPFRLDDPDLTPAGPCTECPKRTGSNLALFGGFTTEQDTCTDRTCFASKQKATLRHHQQAAKASGGRLLKVSSKHSRDLLEEPAVKRFDVPASPGLDAKVVVEITKKTVREGQWVPAEKDSCADAIAALMVDGPDKGKLKTVCANQKCKVHKHQCNSSSSRSSGSASSETPEQVAAREAKAKKLIDDELAIRKAVLDALIPKIGTGWKVLQRFVAAEIDRGAAVVCSRIGLAFPEPHGGGSWHQDQVAGPALAKYVMNATQEQLARVAFEYMLRGAHDVQPYELAKQNIEESRRDLWATAKALGINADAIANRMAPKPPKTALAKRATAKTPAKKAAKKKVAAKKAVPKKLSAEGRKRIADNMKKRWAKARKVAAK